MIGIEYKCNNCDTIFANTDAFFAHAFDCTQKYHNKARYIKIHSTSSGQVKKEVIVPNRYQDTQRAFLYRYISERDGEHCIHCGIAPARDGPTLEIDHADNNPFNGEPSNLHLLCKTCNVRYRQLSTEEHCRQINLDSARNERERNRGCPNTRVSKLLIDYNSGSQEMKANSIFEREFRDWIYNILDTQAQILWDEALNAGAELCGCSPLTTKRYLEKLCSGAGNLEKVRNELNQWIVRRRKA